MSKYICTQPPPEFGVTRRLSLRQTYVPLTEGQSDHCCQLGADLPADCSIFVVRQQQMISHPEELWSVAQQRWTCWMTVVSDLHQRWADNRPTSTVVSGRVCHIPLISIPWHWKAWKRSLIDNHTARSGTHNLLPTSTAVTNGFCTISEKKKWRFPAEICDLSHPVSLTPRPQGFLLEFSIGTESHDSRMMRLPDGCVQI